MANEKFKILVADDEARIRHLIKMYLEKEAFEIVEAKDGEEALNLALETNFSLIILDLMMPKINGIEVCKEIRKKKQTPILILTAKGEETIRVQGFEA